MGFFADVAEAPPDPIFGLMKVFQADERACKVNLTVGLFKNEQLQTPIMQVVKKAETEALQQEKSKEYFPIEGGREFLSAVGPLVFGEPFWRDHAGRIAGCQSVGGTGGLRLGGEFLQQEASQVVAISQPTWPNHGNIFLHCRMHLEQYPYYDEQRQNLAFDQMLDAVSKLQPGTIVLLHASCHNPTGADLSLEQWRALSELLKTKRLIPFFDFAYQGFGKGIEEDAQAVRLFASEGHEMLVCVSFSKNFSLYGERTGALFVVTGSAKEAENVTSQLRVLVRALYSNPSIHGAKIVTRVLTSTTLRKEWESELTAMRERIDEMRKAFVQALMDKKSKVDFRFLLDRRGMFCFTGLRSEQVDRLMNELAIYMTSDGRINVTGLNWDNLNYVVDGIIRVL